MGFLYFYLSMRHFETRGGGGGGGGGGYSLYDGWYICAAVLTPFFDLLGTKLDLFGVFFLIHQHKNDLLGTNPRKIRSFWPQHTIFPSIFLGPIFSGPRHTPSNFGFEITVVTNSSDLRNDHMKKTRPAWFYCMTTKHTSCDLTREITSQ